MTKKAVIAAVCLCCAAALLIFTFLLRGTGDNIMSLIPRPDETGMYAVAQTTGGAPRLIVSLFAESFGSEDGLLPVENAVLAAAAAASESALLAEKKDGKDEYSLCAALRFSSSELAELRKGRIGKELKTVLKDAVIKETGTKGVFAAESPEFSGPLFYRVYGKYVAAAPAAADLNRIEEARKDKRSNLGGKKWKVEKDWPAHIEISDGGALTANAKEKFPITIEAAWRTDGAEGPMSPEGEARWAVVSLSKPAELWLSRSLKAKKWNTSDYFIPEPLLISAGINMPELRGKHDNWVFPLSSFGETAENIGLSEAETREILAGQTVFSVGGQNKILWFSVPGFLVEFTGRAELMKELVEKYWEGLFFGADPAPIPGFDSGGTANLPFSAIGVSRGNTALLGLTTPRSVEGGSATLGKYLDMDKDVIGWAIADLPRVGSALADMTRLSGLFDDDITGKNEESWEYPYDEDDEESIADMLRQDMSADSFDEEIVSSFSNVLKGMGRVFILWEKPLSGRLFWYSPTRTAD